MSDPSTSASAGGAFLTPRVLDQEAFDELGSALRDLITQATRVRDELGRELEHFVGLNEDATEASKTLQERLRLSARMLQAFQSQINHVEASFSRVEQFESRIEDATRRLNDTMAEMEGRIDTVLAGAESRLGELVDQAVDRFEREAESRREQLASRGPQIESLLERADALLSVGEQAEVNVAQAAWRFGEVRRNVDAAAQEASRAAEYCQSTSRRLQDELLESADQLDELSLRAERVRKSLQGDLNPVEEAIEQLRTERASLNDALATLREGHAMAAEVRNVLATLEPWQRQLQPNGQGGQGGSELPEPIARLVDQVRHQLGQELAAFSTALRVAAGRLEEMGDQSSARRDPRACLDPDREEPAATEGPDRDAPLEVTVLRQNPDDAAAPNASSRSAFSE